jgi:hypothetical protein
MTDSREKPEFEDWLREADGTLRLWPMQDFSCGHFQPGLARDADQLPLFAGVPHPQQDIAGPHIATAGKATRLRAAVWVQHNDLGRRRVPSGYPGLRPLKSPFGSEADEG